MSRFIQNFPQTGEAPDMIKASAAILMVLDHINILFLGGIPILWVLGRTVFPLFCFTVALHLARGVDGKTYLKKLLPFALLAQIPHTWALWEPVMDADIHKFFFNVIFTLALGGFIAPYLMKARNWVKFGLLVLAIAIEPIVDIFEFGLVGMLLPTFFLMIIKGEKGGWPLTLLAMYLVNYDADIIGIGPVANFVYFIMAATYIILTLWIIFELSKLKDGKRFLPKYFLHFFYPAHFIVLGLIAKFL